MKKYSKVFLTIAVLMAMTSIFSIIAHAADLDKAKAGKELINKVTQSKYGSIEEIANESEKQKYSDLFKEKVMLFQDDCFVYLLSDDVTNIRAIMPVKKQEKGMFSIIESSAQASDIVLSMTRKANPKFFDKSFDVFSNENGDGKDKSYSIEIWQKTDNNIYTGNKISVLLTSDGFLDLYLSRDSGFTELKNIALMNKEKAIDIAYIAAEKKCSELVYAESAYGFESSNRKPEPSSDPIISDTQLAGLKESTGGLNETQDPYKIFINNRGEHVVKSYMEYFDGNIFWVITIDNVKTNREWGPLSFYVKVNAGTGDVQFITSTR